MVSFSCNQGFKFEGNHKFITEFKLQCSSKNTWAGFVPDCIPLSCPKPNHVRNGQIFILTEVNLLSSFNDNLKIHYFN